MPYRSGASALVYHREVKTIKAGAMTASHIPNKVRTAMIVAVLWHAAEQQRMIPHRKILHPRTFEIEKYRRRTPARLSLAFDVSNRSNRLTLGPFSNNVAYEECCCCPREVLALHMKVFLQTHHICILRSVFISFALHRYRSIISYVDGHLVQELQKICKKQGRNDAPVDFPNQSCLSDMMSYGYCWVIDLRHFTARRPDIGHRFTGAHDER
jgi:hypothetical protein